MIHLEDSSQTSQGVPEHDSQQNRSGSRWRNFRTVCVVGSALAGVSAPTIARATDIVPPPGVADTNQFGWEYDKANNSVTFSYPVALAPGRRSTTLPEIWIYAADAVTGPYKPLTALKERAPDVTVNLGAVGANTPHAFYIFGEKGPDGNYLLGAQLTVSRPAPKSTACEVNVHTGTGLTYQLQESSTSLPGSWHPVVGVSTFKGDQTFKFDGRGAPRFFRVEAVGK